MFVKHFGRIKLGFCVLCPPPHPWLVPATAEQPLAVGLLHSLRNPPLGDGAVDGVSCVLSRHQFIRSDGGNPP